MPPSNLPLLHAQSPLLMVISDPERCGPLPLLEALLEAAHGGAQLLQLRAKSWSAREQVELGRALRKRLPPHTRLLMNDRVDIALACEADGVHLPEQGLPPSVVRGLLGPQALIGCSVHSLESAKVVADEVDYLLVGTMFETSCKPGKHPEGPALLQEIKGFVRCPLFGVGGITTENAASLLKVGASGVAVVSYVLQHPHPQAQAAALKAVLEAAS